MLEACVGELGGADEVQTAVDADDVCPQPAGLGLGEGDVLADREVGDQVRRIR